MLIQCYKQADTWNNGVSFPQHLTLTIDHNSSSEFRKRLAGRADCRRGRGRVVYYFVRDTAVRAVGGPARTPSLLLSGFLRDAVNILHRAGVVRDSTDLIVVGPIISLILQVGGARVPALILISLPLLIGIFLPLFVGIFLSIF